MFVPLSVRFPEPACTKLPLPDITVEKSTPCVTVLLRLKTRVPSFAIALLEPRLPVVPPSPIRRVPALIVVEPE